MTTPPGRYDKRTAAAVAVMLTSPERAFNTELALTENISERGARVLTRKVWWANESVVIKSLEGDLQSEARVVYRQPVLSPRTKKIAKKMKNRKRRFLVNNNWLPLPLFFVSVHSKDS
jgi:hypothetical protein